MQSTPLAGTFDRLTFGLEQNRLDAEERQRGGTRLGGGGARQRSDEDTAGFGLPPGIDDRALLMTDVLVIPHPGLGIDRLTNGTEQTQAGEIAFGDMLLALAHQGSDGGRSSIELVDLVLVADVPETTGVGVSRDALEHDRGSPVGQRAVDDVRVTGNPADVGPCTSRRRPSW